MKFLVDSNVLSEWTKSRRDPAVLDWFRSHFHDIGVTPIVLGEVEYGVLILPASRRQRELKSWLDELATAITIIPFEPHDGFVWAQLLARLHKQGTPMPVSDSLIAASALARGLTLVTRNVRHFHHTGVKLLNPFR